MIWRWLHIWQANCQMHRCISQHLPMSHKMTVMISKNKSPNDWKPWNYFKRLSDAEKVSKKKGSILFKASCLFDQSVYPSLWTVCNSAPVHAKVCYNAYSFGFGCNTMEGRVQKHQAISKYAHNTTYQHRWPLIFRHEYIHLVYLRENGFDHVKYNKKHIPYILDVDRKIHCMHCCLELKIGNCELYSSVFMEKVKKVISEN